MDVATGGTDFSTIGSAVSALAALTQPISPSGDACVVIRDTQTYSEQVTVQGILLAAASSRL